MIRLRNPWGASATKEDMWTGIWCSDDRRWRTVYQQDRERSLKDDGVNGEFLMPYDMFCRYFQQLCVLMSMFYCTREGSIATLYIRYVSLYINCFPISLAEVDR